MVIGHETTVESRHPNPHIALMDFLDASAARSQVFMLLGNLSSQGFADTFHDRRVDEFKQELAHGAEVVNELFNEIGGIPVEFTNESDGEQVKGTVIKCTGYDLEANTWQMLLTNDQMTILPGRGITAMEVIFGPGEFREYYQRTLGYPSQHPLQERSLDAV